MMIRRVKWLEFAGKGKDLAGMTADTANTPHRGFRRQAPAPPLTGGFRRQAPAAPSSGDCARQRGDLLSRYATSQIPCRSPRGPLQSGQKKARHAGFLCMWPAIWKASFPLTGDSVALLRRPRPPAAGRCKTDKRKPGGTPLPHRGFRRFAPASPPACGGLCKPS